jgi:hypothetical protein
MEVHISNIHARDELHRHLKVSAAAAVICGRLCRDDGCGGADGAEEMIRTSHPLR